jgi:hypothetical protein
VTRRWRRVVPVAVVAVAVAAVLASWAVTRPRSPDERLAAARELASRITVTAVVEDSSLLGGRAIADFGVGNEVRLVRVRIVDQLHLSVRLASDVDVELATALTACLVGPYSAPDDAGLSVPCWGEPDLGGVLATRLSTSATGHSAVLTTRPVDVAVELSRGEARCDYAPGRWRLEVSVEPIVNGASAGVIDLPTVDIAIPFSPDDVVIEVRDSRYCGLAETIFKEQGEPATATPRP